MGTTKFYYTPGSVGYQKVATLSRAVFALSLHELGLSKSNVNAEGTKLPIVSTLKIATYGGKDVAQFIRTPTLANQAVVIVNTQGTATGVALPASNFSARPAFTLPTSITINADGTVTTNTAPSTPPSISVPAKVNGGSTVTIEWTASSDAENNLEGYIVERSIDGGDAWTQIYQGSRPQRH